MIKNIILLLLLSFYTQTYAQNYFKGIISEESTTATVSDAIITIEGTAFSQSTNASGQFNFTEKIPAGEHVVTITKENYVTKYFLLQITDDKGVTMNDLKIEVDRKEQKRRDKELKHKLKQEKRLEREREHTLAQAQKNKEKEDKELERRKRQLQKESSKNEIVVINNEPNISKSIDAIEENNVSQLQIKYGAILNVTPDSITNTKLFEFIDEWNGTTYLMGGATKDGIDCSSFTQRLHTTVFDRYIERTAQEQFKSKLTERFSGKEFLEEGDLLFFNKSGNHLDPITHVGVYLGNNRFVHSTSYSKDTGKKGVKIGNLDLNYWNKKFAAAGRRPKNE